ncbi:Alpha/beta hydrolase fold [Trema orientale]|uniref:Alpha/beta hydrolase fold n=1 Tax=Trema orientale TaxID=63057 RepID=A0A2P5FE10_TREOI|nr:Alpha/beta hydrolase fold [Trema orientale]
MAVNRPSPTQKERASNPDIVIRQRRVIVNSNGEKLVGILHDTGSKELVIVCHGLQSSKERIPMVNLAAALEKERISAFRFDFSGNGESEGSFRYGNYYREANDLRDVVQHFRGENLATIAIVGHSKGGNVVVLYAAKHNDVHTVVNISGRFDLERGIEGRLGKDFLQRIKQDGFIDVKNKRGKFEYRVTEESLTDRLTTDTRGACKSIDPNCRVLTVHGTMDKIVPVEDAFEFNKFIPNHKLRIVEGADHEYTWHQDELASIVLDFIKAGFRQDHGVFRERDDFVKSRL